ncbi:hypothetical protein DFP72DRAFT_1060599 [Ephemerocybe angulata]|uniref:Secreted protein n=1 Tax=Ephemerocybe angulata TaxID=980116 RepID=A0A8H6MCI1_9AGAR|nr:hypothetical protein DFP72DRAFT_1060599 [Tulosesus angulatus]
MSRFCIHISLIAITPPPVAAHDELSSFTSGLLFFTCHVHPYVLPSRSGLCLPSRNGKVNRHFSYQLDVMLTSSDIHLTHCAEATGRKASVTAVEHKSASPTAISGPSRAEAKPCTGTPLRPAPTRWTGRVSGQPMVARIRLLCPPSLVRVIGRDRVTLRMPADRKTDGTALVSNSVVIVGRVRATRRSTNLKTPVAVAAGPSTVVLVVKGLWCVDYSVVIVGRPQGRLCCAEKHVYRDEAVAPWPSPVCLAPAALVVCALRGRLEFGQPCTVTAETTSHPVVMPS